MVCCEINESTFFPPLNMRKITTWKKRKKNTSSRITRGDDAKKISFISFISSKTMMSTFRYVFFEVTLVFLDTQKIVYCLRTHKSDLILIFNSLYWNLYIFLLPAFCWISNSQLQATCSSRAHRNFVTTQKSHSK